MSIEALNLYSTWAKNYNLILTDRNCSLGVLNKSRDVRAKEVLSLTESNNKRCVLASSQNQIREIFVNYKNGERSVQAVYDLAKGRN